MVRPQAGDAPDPHQVRHVRPHCGRRRPDLPDAGGQAREGAAALLEKVAGSNNENKDDDDVVRGAPTAPVVVGIRPDGQLRLAGRVHGGTGAPLLVRRAGGAVSPGRCARPGHIVARVAGPVPLHAAVRPVLDRRPVDAGRGRRRDAAEQDRRVDAGPDARDAPGRHRRQLDAVVAGAVPQLLSDARPVPGPDEQLRRAPVERLPQLFDARGRPGKSRGRAAGRNQGAEIAAPPVGAVKTISVFLWLSVLSVRRRNEPITYIHNNY